MAMSRRKVRGSQPEPKKDRDKPNISSASLAEQPARPASDYARLWALHTRRIAHKIEDTKLFLATLRNIRYAGDIVETHVRGLLRELIPTRFHVTHGYIASTTDKTLEPMISPHLDVIVVDTLVPCRLAILDPESGMELVPESSVVGIFEVKRTLNRASLIEANTQLVNALRVLGITKQRTQRFLPGGLELGSSGNIKVQGGLPANPMIGIIGISSPPGIYNLVQKLLVTERKLSGYLDIIASLDGSIMVAVGDRQSNNVVAKTIREPNESMHYRISLRNELRPRDFPKLATERYFAAETVLAQAMGYISIYLQQVCGRGIGDYVPYIWNNFV